MNITVMRQVDFCAGHRLMDHEGKCANLHGHNYVVEFHVTAAGTDALGRIVDFAVINRLFKSWIEEHWDHGFVVWEIDREVIAALQSVTPNRIYLLPDNPTAENMARHLAEEIGPRLLRQVEGYDLRLEKVVLWETPGSSATVTARTVADPAAGGRLRYPAESSR